VKATGSMRLLRAGERQALPWKNGGGVTRSSLVAVTKNTGG